MKEVFQNALALTMCLCCTVCTVSTGLAAERNVTSVLQLLNNPLKDTSPLRLELKEVEAGLVASIRFENTEETKEKSLTQDLAKGYYILFLDGLIVSQNTFEEKNLEITHELPLTTQNGEHTLLCELRDRSGKLYTQSIPFKFDGSPSITTQAVTIKSGEVDLLMTLDFFGQENGVAGFLDIHLDERLITAMDVSPENTHKEVLLSELSDTPLALEPLAQGEHLIRLQATGKNGSSSVVYTSFSVNTPPSLKINRDSNELIKDLVVSFAQVPSGYTGSVNLFYRQGVILSIHSKDPVTTISRSNILEAFEKHNHTIPDQPVSMVLALRSANGLEKWQEVSFK